MIILGIDPGVATVGYGIIQIKPHGKILRNERPRAIDFGCIFTKASLSPPQRLKIIHNQIDNLIKKHSPNIISVESLYFFKNLKTAIPVSQAKGVILLAAAKRDIPVVEFTPLQVKMTVVGYGKAEKKQVQRMTKELLDMGGLNLDKEGRKKDDAADALGLALCGYLKGLKSFPQNI